MTTDLPSSAERPPRFRRDQGAAMVEFALIMSLLFLLIFGIINFGLILSFKQDVTRSAAEGARAGAVAFPATNALTDAQSATEQSMTAAGHPCNDGTGASCTWYLHDCTYTGGATGLVWPQPTANDVAAPDCVRVTISYDYKNHPLLGKPPLLAGFLPDTITSTSDARVNS